MSLPQGYARLFRAIREDVSVRHEATGCAAMLGALVILRPEPIWWAVALAATFTALALELANSAVETLADHLHPERDPAIGRAKDLFSAAATVADTAQIVIGLLMVLHATGVI